MPVIRTIKIPYTCSDLEFGAAYADLNREQANIIRFAYNRYQDGLSEKEIRPLLKSLNNVTQDSWFQQSAIRVAKGMWESKVQLKTTDTSMCFGRKALEAFRLGKITKEELKAKRTFGISSIGEAPNYGNRKFNFISPCLVEFKPHRGSAFSLKLKPRNNQYKYLKAICDLSAASAAPVTVKLTKTHLHLTFDTALMKSNYTGVAGRAMGIDQNPNRIGYCIKDENKIYKSEELDFMDLRLWTKRGFASSSTEKLYLNNKKAHETIEAAHYLVKQAQALHCSSIIIEDLQGLRSEGTNKNLNRCTNNDFKRVLFENVLEKLCAMNNIQFKRIKAAYTSFFGAVKYGHVLPDPLSAAACTADAGLLDLKHNIKGNTWKMWFNRVQLDASLSAKGTYLAQWKQRDLCFASMKSLYESVKNLCASTGNMSTSYHTFLCSCALRAKRHKSEKSSVTLRTVL